MKLWGGRFSGKRDPDFERFSESFSVDQRLVVYDLAVNRAYVKALGAARVLRPGEVRKLVRGLESLLRDVDENPAWARAHSNEDVHTWVEARLEARVGAVAQKLRTGRSRNDLVATTTRLFAKGAIRDLEQALVDCLQAFLDQIRSNSDVIMPGYTHLQPAQPVLFAHCLLAYFEMLLRDAARLEDCAERTDELPMGAGALAGASFPINREALARELGFRRVTRNSIDATCDRDFVAELLFVCALLMTHLSRLAEDLIIFSSPAFGFVEIADEYSTGSSLMPQKKNPDSLELIRGKTARVLGRVTSMLALLKGLPLAYDRDLQEDKAMLFDGVDTVRDSLLIAARVIRSMRLRPGRMESATTGGFLTATDVADELVDRGVPFAKAHEQVGGLVQYCVQNRSSFAEVPDTEARRFIPLWDAALREVARSPALAVERRNVVGGTAPVQVRRQMRAAERAITMLKRKLEAGAPSRESNRPR